jgi:hypothetical protein
LTDQQLQKTSTQRVTPGSDDPDADLLKVLAVAATSRVVRMRVLLGDNVTDNIAIWLGAAAASRLRKDRRLTRANTIISPLGIAGGTRPASRHGSD